MTSQGARLESSDAEAENRCNESPDSPSRKEKRRSQILMGHFLLISCYEKYHFPLTFFLAELGAVVDGTADVYLVDIAVP